MGVLGRRLAGKSKRRGFTVVLVLLHHILVTYAVDAFSQSNPVPINIAVPRIANLLEENNSGIYQKIFEEALPEPGVLGYRISQPFFPYKRALNVFLSNSVDCVYSFTKVAERELGKEKVIASFPLGAFGYFMFSRKEEKPLTRPEQLIGKRVGGVVGHDSYYQSAIGDLNLHLVTSDEQNIELLKLGRIDHLIGAIPDILPYAGELSYSLDAPLVKSFDRITCHNNEQNRQFLSVLSSRLRELKQQGGYQRLAGSLYLDFDESKQ